jgi:mannose-6-phosphate isomerase-like protein (cupin superfamily)
MPYVPADEAQNHTLMDLGSRELQAGPTRRRVPLVASDALRVVFLRLPQGDEPHLPHRHPRADEVMLVREGRATFAVGDEPSFVAGPGSLVYVPRGVVHHLRAMGPEPLVILSIITPNQDLPDESVEEAG